MKASIPFRHLRIRTKLIIAFLATGLVPVLVLGTFSLVSTRKALQHSAASQIHASLSAKVKQLQDTLRYAEKDLRLLSQSPSLVTFAEFYPGHVVGRDNLNRMLITALEDFAEENPLYREVLLLDPEGEQILRVFRKVGKLAVEGTNPSLNRSRESFFWQALDTRGGDIVITSSALKDRQRKEPLWTLVYSTAIYDRGHTRKGVLAVQFLIRDLAKLAGSGENAMGSAYLLDRGGTFLYTIDTDETRSVQGGFPGALGEGTLRQILSGREGLITEEKDRILSYAPVFPGFGGPDNFWVVAIDLSRSVVQAPVTRFLLFFGIMVVALTVIGIFLGITASHHFTRPILELHRGAQVMATGNFDHKIVVRTSDEIEDLADQFNLMAERLKASQDRLTEWNRELQEEVKSRTEQLFQAEKMAALGSLSAGIAHEIGNPLAAMKTNIQVLEERLGTENTHYKFLQRILKEIDRLSRFFKTFSSFARPVTPRIAPCDISKVIREVVFFVQKEAEARGVSIRLEFEPSVPQVLADFQRMQQVFFNLLLNAIQASGAGGTITLKVHPVSKENADGTQRGKVRIIVSDTGTGIAEEARSKIFEPFFTTKPDGTGLGLSIVHQIVTENRGTIALENTAGPGTTFSIHLEAAGSPVMAGTK